MRTFLTAVVLFLAILPTSSAWQPVCSVRRSLPFRTRQQSSMQPKSPTSEAHFLKRSSAIPSTAATEEPWTEPRLHNTAAFRSMTLLLTLAAAGSRANLSSAPAQAIAALHMLSFATWYGTMAYTTFIVGITMFKNLPRKTFGKLQAKLFPKYFMLSSVAILLQLTTLRGLTASALMASKSSKSLLVALVMTLVNQYGLEPMATENMMRRYELDGTNQQDSEEYKTLKKKFGKVHGISSLTNLIALCAATAHGYFLAGAFV